MIERLEAFAPRGLLMVPVCIVGFNIWRGQPLPFAHLVNAGGVLAIILMLAAFRMAPREVISTALLLMLGCTVAVLATPYGEPSNVARVFIGGLFLAAAWTATEHSETSWDWALSVGLWAEVVAWALGNAGRGTFGPDLATSALGQAYGPEAQAAQWSVIAAAYFWAWHKARRV